MQKIPLLMSAFQYDKYLWLLNTILSAGRITFAEIERKWAQASQNENGDSRLPRSSFNAMREQVEMMFGVEIRCDRRTNEYYVEGDVRQLRGRREMTHWERVGSDKRILHPLPEQRVVLHTIPEVADDLRLHPLHPSQQETLPHTSSHLVEFTYWLSPTLMFYAAVHAMSCFVEVVEPAWLRDAFRKDTELMYLTYCENYSMRKEAEELDAEEAQKER